MDQILAVGGFRPEYLAVMGQQQACVDIVDCQEAIDHFREHHAETAAVVMSLRMESMDGCDVMEVMHRVDPDIPVIISTHDTAVSVIVNAMERGAFSYIYEPDLVQHLPFLLERAVKHISAIRENRRLQSELGKRDQKQRFVGISASARQVVETIEKVADSTIPVLFSGESGTGKEIAARILHDMSPRNGSAFVAVNCGALAPTLLDSELFGHTKGAFTGANEDRAGLFEQAHGGTLFLDELGATDTNFQVKLLRVLEDGEVRRVGGSEARQVDVRVVAATNEPLEQAIRSGNFRQDLFYRLNVVPIEIAPLRERGEDIAVLAYHFLEELRRQYPAAPVRIAPAALKRLEAYGWPGNVRELRNVMEHAVLLGGKESIRPSDLPERISSTAASLAIDETQGLDAALALMEQAMISKALRQAKGNKAQAARLLRIKRTTLLAKMARLGINDR